MTGRRNAEEDLEHLALMEGVKNVLVVRGIDRGETTLSTLGDALSRTPSIFPVGKNPAPARIVPLYCRAVLK